MKTTALLFALLGGSAFAQYGRQPVDLVPIQMELNRLNVQLQVMQAQQARRAPTYVPGESLAQRSTRHARVLAEAESAYKADWQAKNRLLPSFRAPKFHKQLAAAALAASDAQQVANTGRQVSEPVRKPDPQIAAMERRIKAIKALEAQLKTARTRQ